MASIMLGSLGATAGTSIFGAAGGAIGQLLGSSIGGIIDSKLFNQNQSITSFGSRLTDATVQSNAYGITIPIVFGTVRIAGNVVWAAPIKEIKSTQTENVGGGKGGKISRSHTEYNYYASFAIILAEGLIKQIGRIWANNKLLDQSVYKIRFYNGSEAQYPDPLIESIQGIGKTPSYRGLAYCVFEDFPITDFGNTIPNLSFEVTRKLEENSNDTVASLVESVVIIPGGGEFVYDTIAHQKLEGELHNGVWYRKGPASPINQHTSITETNCVVSLKQLKDNLPNVKWVSPVVTWLATELDAAKCKILPGVEYKSTTFKTTPTEWKVAAFNRANAHLITQMNNRPLYGGTPTDKSIIRYLEHCKKAGYKIMFNPMFFIDQPHKPWRGRLKCQAQEVHNFFNKPLGYNEFIIHYAELTKGLVDAFIIGSELIGLTSIKDSQNNFPAVNELIKLAHKIKAISGKNVKVTYAADWSEYHHTENGWYNLDPLWDCDSIDMIGIDAYFPLTDSKSSTYKHQKIMNGWTHGEGYDFYYEDKGKQSKKPLNQAYAWKNIQWWWENDHINSDGKKTLWQPRSKKIWFTEYGYPSVDCASNQPNIFYDPSSIESGLPKYSKGIADFKAQASAIVAMEKKWQNSEFIERKFLWCWDARPFPHWPDLGHIWSDNYAWLKGHWINGKLNTSLLNKAITDLCLKAGIDESLLAIESLHRELNGMVINQPYTTFEALKLLQNVYNFSIFEADGKLNFHGHHNQKINPISFAELIRLDDISKSSIMVENTDENKLPSSVVVNFIDPFNEYKINTQTALRTSVPNDNINTINLPLCLNIKEAKNIADYNLHNAWQRRREFSFTLPFKYFNLNPYSLIEIQLNQKTHLLKIKKINLIENLNLQISAYSESFNPDIIIGNSMINSNSTLKTLTENHIRIMELPALPNYDLSNKFNVIFAASGPGDSWEGCLIYASFNQNKNFRQLGRQTVSSTFGTALDALPPRSPYVRDNVTKLKVTLLNGELNSIDDSQFFNGGNLAIIAEEIVHFKTAKLISPFVYELSDFLRGRQGTEDKINNHSTGEDFTILDDSFLNAQFTTEDLGKILYIKIIKPNQLLESAPVNQIILHGNSLKPFSVAHLKCKINNKQLSLSWRRRNNIDGALRSNVEIPQHEPENYACEFFNNKKQCIFSTTMISNNLTISLEQFTEKLSKIIVTPLSTKVGFGFPAEILII